MTYSKKAIESLSSGKVDLNVYEALNLVLTDHSEDGKVLSKGLYDTLKSKGYDAIKDINDSKYSGFKSINPIVVFNGSSKTSVDGLRKLGEQEIEKKRALHTAELVTRIRAARGAELAAETLVVAGTVKAVKAESDAKYVSKYREQHPNTKLSYKEIVRTR